MTAPKKPRSASTAPATAPAKLTANQLRVAQLYGSMTEEAQAGALPIIEAWAESFPRRARPALRLIGGAS